MSIAEGDYEKGKEVFKQMCANCHAVSQEPEQSSIGPTLYGVVNRDYMDTRNSFGIFEGSKNLFPKQI
ncbi:Cytochrome c domain-containing protein [Aphelenchoides besseyi]|nr:Cytochrome c domain-containing protein [Aphelenchoides besseyi]KAI6199766.1 Cytochrome c domain-containing protein [Aphelenchoides besseyi]